MARTQSLGGADLEPVARRSNGTPQRGEDPVRASSEPVRERMVPMQFKMRASFARKFKIAAAGDEKKLNAFLEACFDAWLERNRV